MVSFTRADLICIAQICTHFTFAIAVRSSLDLILPHLHLGDMVDKRYHSMKFDEHVDMLLTSKRVAGLAVPETS